MEPIYRCIGCGGWFRKITIIGDYIPGEFGPMQLCDDDLNQLTIDLGIEL